jgi:hypothetical protein
MLKSSPAVKSAVESAMERMQSGKSDSKPEPKPSKPYSLYGGLGYDKVMAMQKAGHGFGNYSGEPRPWNKAKGGAINLDHCSVSTAPKGKKNSDW